MKKIALITNPKKDADYSVTERYERELDKYDCSYSRVPFGAQLDADTDLALVFGGDGTIMKTAHITAPMGIPILGINLGKVGYMAELDSDETNMLSEYFRGNYHTQERMMLTVTDCNGAKHTALNDAVISLGPSAKMITVTLDSNGETVAKYYGNGVIVSTPTGSTAYSLSAGGPIVSPSISCLVVTPICSHSLSARPMIFDDEGILTVTNTSVNETNCVLCVDGIDIITVKYGESIQIEKSDLKTKFIRLRNDGFYKILGKKMKN